MTLTFDLLTFKVRRTSSVTWSKSVRNLNEIEQSPVELLIIFRIFAHVMSRYDLDFDLLTLNFTALRVSCVKLCTKTTPFFHFWPPILWKLGERWARSLYQLLNLYLPLNLRNTFDGHPLRGCWARWIDKLEKVTIVNAVQHEAARATPCQFRSRWTYPLPYYSVFDGDTLLYLVTLTFEFWPKTFAVCRLWRDETLYQIWT